MPLSWRELANLELGLASCWWTRGAHREMIDKSVLLVGILRSRPRLERTTQMIKPASNFGMAEEQDICSLLHCMLKLFQSSMVKREGCLAL